MFMLKISVIDPLYFGVTAPCGQSFNGMRHTDDVRIVIDRAMDHPRDCERCADRRRSDRPDRA